MATLRKEQGLTWWAARELAKKSGGIVRDEAGRRWCRRPGGDDQMSRVAETLNPDLPDEVDPEDGDWRPLKDVLREFGVHRATAKRHGHVGRPGFGYLGKRSVYIWVDDDFRNRLP